MKTALRQLFALCITLALSTTFRMIEISGTDLDAQFYRISAALPKKCFGPVNLFVRDSCRRTLYSTLGGMLWQSRDHGASWTSVKNVYQNKYVNSNSLSSNGCKTFVHWGSTSDDPFSYAMELDDTSSVKIINPTQPWTNSAMSAAKVDSLIVVEGAAIPDNLVDISWDGGKSWDRVSYPVNRRPSDVDHIIRTGMGRVALILKDSIPLEFNSRDHTISSAPVPANTQRYIYLDTLRIISTQKYGNDSSSISYSMDGGKSWVILDSLRFVNDTSLITGTYDNMHAIWMHRFNVSTCTLVLKSSTSPLIISTKDGGKSWFLNGRLPEIILDKIQNVLTVCDDGSILISENNLLYVLSSPTDTLTIVSKMTPGFSGIICDDRAHVVGISDQAVWFSNDSGKSWSLATYNLDPDYLPLGREAGPLPASIERIAVFNDTLYAFSPELGAVVAIDSSRARFSYSGSPYLRSRNFSCNDTWFSVRGSLVSDFTGEFLYGVDSFNFYALSKSTIYVDVLPIFETDPSYFTLLKDGRGEFNG